MASVAFLGLGSAPTAYTTYTRTCLFKIITLTHTHTLLHTTSFIAHLLSRTTLALNSLTVRSYTISFVYASFPCPLHLLFLLKHDFSHMFFTHNMVTHHLSHASLSHTIFHTQLCYTQLFTYNLLTHQSSTTSFVYPSFPVPLELSCSCLLEKIDLWGYPIL